MDSVFLGKMLKLCPGYAGVIVSSVLSPDFDRRGVGTVHVLRSLPTIECIPSGRAARGSAVCPRDGRLNDGRLNEPQRSWICLLCSMGFSEANYTWLARGEGRYPLPTSTGLVEGVNVSRQLSPLQLSRGKEACEQSLNHCSVWFGLYHLLCWFQVKMTDFSLALMRSCGMVPSPGSAVEAITSFRSN